MTLDSNQRPEITYPCEWSYKIIGNNIDKILEAIESELGLTKEQNRYAYEVLRNNGNMSSPTVLFVVQELMKSLKEEDQGKRILSFAFGPGLTLESMVLRVQSSKFKV